MAHPNFGDTIVLQDNRCFSEDLSLTQNLYDSLAIKHVETALFRATWIGPELPARRSILARANETLVDSSALPSPSARDRKI